MMARDRRLEDQINLILRTLDGAAAFPVDWKKRGDVDYLYREGGVLVRDEDVDLVRADLRQLLTPEPTDDTHGGADRAEREEDFTVGTEPVVHGVTRLWYRAKAPVAAGEGAAAAGEGAAAGGAVGQPRQLPT